MLTSPPLLTAGSSHSKPTHANDCLITHIRKPFPDSYLSPKVSVLVTQCTVSSNSAQNFLTTEKKIFANGDLTLNLTIANKVLWQSALRANKSLPSVYYEKNIFPAL